MLIALFSLLVGRWLIRLPDRRKNKKISPL